MKKRSVKLVYAFWLIAALDVSGILLSIDWLHYLTKPLLMPALILILLQAGNSIKSRSLMVAALFFSWLGDVLLLFEWYNGIFFIAGLSAFLITHTLYIIYFLGITSVNRSLLLQRPWLIILVVVYCTSLFALLMPSLGPLQIPVLGYTVVIGCMLLASLHVYNKVGKPVNMYFVTGALLFIISDSILALNRFLIPVQMGGALVMLTYCAAQYFLVKGVCNPAPDS